MSAKNFKVGLIVPSSNTTMETEIPAGLAARNGGPAPVVSSAGALVRAAKALGARKVT